MVTSEICLLTPLRVVTHKFDLLGRVFTPDRDRKIWVLLLLDRRIETCQTPPPSACSGLGVAVLGPRSLVSWPSTCRRRNSRAWLWVRRLLGIYTALVELRFLSNQCQGCRGGFLPKTTTSVTCAIQWYARYEHGVDTDVSIRHSAK